MSDDFHQMPFDDGTLTKLQIFELYTKEWIPVFLSSPEPKFDAVHIYDFFCGPGTDCNNIFGSPLRILTQLQQYHAKRLAGWDRVPIVVHFFDRDLQKITCLKSIISNPRWTIPNVRIDCTPMEFNTALGQHATVLNNHRAAKLLIIDQYGVDAVSNEVFRNLITFPTTDFIFFLSSSTLHRFRNHSAIKQKIEQVEDSYDVHRAAFDYYHQLVPTNTEVYLGRFSIKKRSNIYGLIFGSHHPLGIHKFLQVAWENDRIAGEANFDIEREHISPNELVLELDIMRPNKLREYEAELEQALRTGKIRSEADLVRFNIQAGMTDQHCTPILKKLKSEGVIELDFRVPNVRRLKNPRPIAIVSQSK